MKTLSECKRLADPYLASHENTRIDLYITRESLINLSARFQSRAPDQSGKIPKDTSPNQSGEIPNFTCKFFSVSSVSIFNFVIFG